MLHKSVASGVDCGYSGRAGALFTRCTVAAVFSFCFCFVLVWFFYSETAAASPQFTVDLIFLIALTAAVPKDNPQC